MDPVTLGIIATLFALATGGATTAAIRRRNRQQRRAQLKEDLRTRRPIGDQRLSIFDVFWDLGASDFALDLMAHNYLLPDDGGDREIFAALSHLEDRVDQHGSYQEFVEDSLEAIQEFYEEHKRAGHRRRLPNLKAAARRVIPVPRRLETDEQLPDAPGGSDEPPPDQAAPPSASKARKRRRLRRGTGQLGLQSERPHDELDIDDLGDVNPLDILQSILDGGLGSQIEKWWKMRNLRQRRGELDDALERLYDFYADRASREHDFYTPLYDAHHRWRDEATRLRFTARRKPWSTEDYELAADVLFELAIDLSEQLARRAYNTTYQTVETIHDHARTGDKAMAGYLVYLNRHAFFAGRHPDYAELARRVEYATQRVREEIIELQDDGVV